MIVAASFPAPEGASVRDAERLIGETFTVDGFGEGGVIGVEQKAGRVHLVVLLTVDEVPAA